MTPKYTHAPRRLPTSGPLGEYNDCLATVKAQIHIMTRNNANVQWLNEVQRMLNRARQNAMDIYPANPDLAYYDDE